MSYLVRVIGGTVLTLLAVVYLASCDNSPLNSNANIMGASKNTPSVVVASDEERADCVLVERVVEGDTIVVAPNRSVRMIGINAPDLTTPTGSPQLYAEESYAKLKSLVEGKEVCLRKDALQEDKDSLGRDLRYVMIDGKNVNGMLVEQGFASVYTQASFEELDAFRYYQDAAEAQGLGMWAKNGTKTTTTTEKETPSFSDDEIVSLSEDGGEVMSAAELDAQNSMDEDDDIPTFNASTQEDGTFVQENSSVTEKYFLTIEEVIKGKKYLGERKKISFRVRSAWDRGNVVYINSEKQQDDAKNFSIMIYTKNRGSFTEKGLDSIAHFYLGETIEAEGIVKFYKGKVVMEVTQFEDIRIL